MAKSLGGFRAALLIGWIVLAAAGAVYAHGQGIPMGVALPVLAAFLVEYPFYLAAASPETRKRLANSLFLVGQTGISVTALLPAVLMVLPYVVCYVPPGAFQWLAFLKLGALGLALGLWYLVFPRHPVVDLGFLALAAAVLIGNYFGAIYLDPYPKLKIAILGHIALFVSVVIILLTQRRVTETGYGLLPRPRDWSIGLIHYLCFLPVAACVAIPLKAVRFVSPAPVWKTAAIFLGFLFVVALFEEFIFRGVLQQWIEEWTGRRTVALALTSILFGFVHLWFRGFPNWRWAIVAGLLGLFCGHARNQAGSIRAGVVTHALVVATWREFFL